MTKKCVYPLLAALVLIFAQSISADPIDAQQARQEAMKFLTQNTSAKKMLKGRVDLQLTYTSQGGEYFAFSAPAGYVLVSGDDRMPAVIGYSDEGEFDMANIPENMRSWLDEYAEQVRYVQSHPGVRIASSADFATGTVHPLLGATKWNQSAPYNNMCPTYTYNDNTYRCATGCVATAMAQVMYYHRWPDVGAGSNSYTCNINSDASQQTTLTTDFSQSRYDWANMLPSYSGSETDAQNNAVAKLMSDCGVAMNMAYGSSSGAVTRIAMNKMATNFRYDKSIRFISRDAYTLDKWVGIIGAELAASRPVIHTGASDQGGHAFVVDGCNNNGYFHVNWGWGGASNGYFLLTDLTPTEQGIGSSEGGYNLRQGLIYSIMPDKGSQAGYALYISQFTTSNDKVQLGGQAAVDWDSFSLLWTGEGTATARVAVGLTDEAGNLLQVLDTGDYSGFDPMYNYSLTFAFQVPSNLTAGTYYVESFVAPVYSTNYQRADVSSATAQRIKIEVKDGYAYFSYPDNAAKLQVKSVSHSDVLAATRPILVKATIANTGAEFADNLCVALIDAGGSVAALSVPKRVDVINGGEAILETTVTPERAGNYTVAVVNASDNSVVAGATAQVSIEAAPADIALAISKQLALTSPVTTTRLGAKVAIRNTGGAFAGRLEALLTEKNSNSILTHVYSDFVTIKQGETKEVAFNTTFTNGEVGKEYRMALRDPHYTSSYYVWGSNLYFTLGASLSGDVNMDGVVNMSDVTDMIDYTLGASVGTFDASEADLNGDGVVDVTDVTLLIGLILN